VRVTTGRLLAGHVARAMAWGPLLAGCLAGIGVAEALLIFAGDIQSPDAIAVGVRASFVPVVVGLAFLPHDPLRLLTSSLPIRKWVEPTLRIGMALPVLMLGGAVQLLITGRALAAQLRFAGQPSGSLPWLALVAELAAWCLLGLAFSAGLERTRWHDVSGIVAAFAAMAAVGAAALLPFHLLPGALTSMDGHQHAVWTTAWRVWAGTAVVAAVVAGWAAGDPWRRVHRSLIRRFRGNV